MKVIFKKCRWKNFLSTGNDFSEVDFTLSKSTLLTGDNGAGKSTVYEALTFGLYGKPFSKFDGKTALINAYNNADCLVEITFSVDGVEFMIRRGMKPTVLEVYRNGEPLNQPNSVKDFQRYIEENVIRINFRTFSQIIVLGSSDYVPFLRLEASKRREVVEDILDLRIFSQMSERLAAEIKTRTTVISDLKLRINVETMRRQEKENAVKRLNELRETVKRGWDSDIEQHERRVQEASRDSGIALIELNAVNWTDDDRDLLHARQAKLAKLRQMQAQLQEQIANANKTRAYFTDHDKCLTCEQSITPELKTERLDVIDGKLERLNKGITQLLAMLDVETTEIRALQDKLDLHNEKRQKLSNANRYLADAQNALSRLHMQIERAKAASTGAVNMDEIAAINTEIRELQEELDAEQYDSEIASVAAMLLRDDGIKANIINDYMPIINETIRKTLIDMEIFTSFTLDSSFNETIRFSDKGKFSYYNFSAGERERVDLAVMLAWRELAERRASVGTNLLFMDEVLDASMDGTGVELFLGILNRHCSDGNVFVISHRADDFLDKFERHLTASKVGNYSQIRDMT